MPLYTAIVTLIAITVYFAFAFRVANAHGKYGVRLPATAGNPDFERVFRAHYNMLEWMPIFLPLLWLTAVYLNDVAAAALGLVWVLGRIWYFVGYSVAVEKRLPGFFVQAMACLMLFIGSIVGIGLRL